MAIRTFYKVGNGLFAVEQSGNMVNIYDCGGQNRTIIKDAVLRLKNNGITHIDNLFISHYDRDHVNGLWLLLNIFGCDRIFLPMVPPLVRVVDFAQHRYDSHYSDFIQSPELFIREWGNNADIINVNEEEPAPGNRDSVIFTQENEDGAPGGFRQAPHEGGNREIANGSDCIAGHWMFRVFNRRVMSIQELSDFMHRLGLNVNATYDDIYKVLANQNIDLKKALRQVFSPQELNLINDYSMTVWSGSTETTDKGGCLFTGDYNAKSNMPQLSAVYKDLKPRTEIVQIPHHGSSYNFNLQLCDSSFKHIFSSSDVPYKSRRIVNPTDTINLLKAKSFSYFTTFKNDIIV